VEWDNRESLKGTLQVEPTMMAEYLSVCSFFKFSRTGFHFVHGKASLQNVGILMESNKFLIVSVILNFGCNRPKGALKTFKRAINFQGRDDGCYNFNKAVRQFGESD